MKQEESEIFKNSGNWNKKADEVQTLLTSVWLASTALCCWSGGGEQAGIQESLHGKSGHAESFVSHIMDGQEGIQLL